MYTKEDTGIKVYLPEWGETPCQLLAVMQNGQLQAVIVSVPKGNNESFTVNGLKQPNSKHPTLSRTPYTPGEPFVCVTERPEPVRDERWESIYHAIANGTSNTDAVIYDISLAATNVCEYLDRNPIAKGCKCGDESTGETSFMLCNICGLTPAKTENELMEETGRLCGDEPEKDKYPNVGESGKIRVTPEQSAAVQKVLIEKGYSWMGSGCKVSNTDKPILCWNSNEITYADDCDSDCVGYGTMIHTIADFYTPAFEGPIEAFSPLTISEMAKQRIYKCKESAYGENTNASNVSEGDFGDWADWQKVLEDFAAQVIAVTLYPDGTAATALTFTRTNEAK